MALPPSAAASLLGPGGAGPSAPPSPLQATLSAFFDHETGEMGAVTDFKSFALPLARIKKIMKASERKAEAQQSPRRTPPAHPAPQSDEDVRMISSEAPALFSKACELFIQEARGSWDGAGDSERARGTQR